MDKLKKYYDENYSSNIMSLTLVGKHSVDDLEAFAVKYFSAIKDKQLPETLYHDQINFSKDYSCGRMYRVVPQQQMR